MPGPPAELLQRTAAHVMIRAPKTLLADSTVADVRAGFEDPHVHLALLTRAGVLLGTLVRTDLPVDIAGDSAALQWSTLDGRTTPPDTPMTDAHGWLLASQQRRLAVVDPAHVLLGLLCLKRDGSGYCTDEGVAARGDEHRVSQHEQREAIALNRC